MSNKKKISNIYKHPSRITLKTKSVKLLLVPGDCWEIAINVKKSVGGAVRRNHIKRKIRECYRHAKPLFTKTFSVIFQVNKDPEDKELNNLDEFLYTGLNR